MRCELVKFQEVQYDPLVLSAIEAGNNEVGGVPWTKQRLLDLSNAGTLLFWRISIQEEIAGFCAMMRVDSNACIQAALFVFDKYRAGGTARNAIKEIDKQLIDIGFTRIYRHVRTNGVGYLHGMGYDFVESLHVLDVGRNNG